jgi:glycosyltransferase involved in cell wall biosynthesis
MQTLPDLVEEFPSLEFWIIGDGPYRKELEESIPPDLRKHIRFFGYVPTEGLGKIMVSCGIGMAPYRPNPKGTSAIGDPGKTRVYMSFGLPVIVTSVPEYSMTIAKERAGIVIRYDHEELYDAVRKLLRDRKFYDSCRVNALRLVRRYLPENMFKDAILGVVAG